MHVGLVTNTFDVNLLTCLKNSIESIWACPDTFYLLGFRYLMRIF